MKVLTELTKNGGHELNTGTSTAVGGIRRGKSMLMTVQQGNSDAAVVGFGGQNKDNARPDQGKSMGYGICGNVLRRSISDSVQEASTAERMIPEIGMPLRGFARQQKWEQRHIIPGCCITELTKSQADHVNGAATLPTTGKSVRISTWTCACHMV